MVKKMRSKRKLFLFHEASKEDVCKKVSKRMPKPPEKWENNFNLEKSSENSTKITNLKEQLLKSMKKSGRTLPNILVTGTPGTGKSLLSKGLASNTPFTLMSISDMVKEKGWYESKDTVLDTFVIDEDTLLDNIEPRLKLGGCIVDFHGCEMFPDAAFDLVIVLRCTTEVLYDRLKERKYSDAKLNQNMECEIMQVILEEVRELYPKNYLELESNIEAQYKSNLALIFEILD